MNTIDLIRYIWAGIIVLAMCFTGGAWIAHEMQPYPSPAVDCVCPPPTSL